MNLSRMSLLHWAYLILAAPLMPLIFRVGGIFNAKMRLGWQLRQPKSGRPSWLVGEADSRPLWFHCASGEFEYAKPVIRLLKQRYPEIPILVTYFSPSVKSSVEKFSQVDLAAPLPWENSKNWQEFLEFYRPRTLLIARTDTWPEMLYQVNLHNIPSLLFSATLVEDSGRLKFPTKYFTKMSLHCLTQIFCVSESDAQLFASLGFSDKTRVAGDTRFDQVITRLKAAQSSANLRQAGDSRNILVAGSTWSEDEVELLKAIPKTRTQIKWVLVPHEPSVSHLEELKQRLQDAEISFSLYSQNSPKPTDVLIVDRLGILAESYLQADFAFVGGSFRRTVHSVMEPLAAGCITFVGPLHLNNREAIEFQNLILLKDIPPVQKVSNSEELVSKLNFLLSLDETQRKELRVQVSHEVHKRSGRSELVVKWIQGNVINPG